MANHEDQKQPKPENFQVQIETLKQAEMFAERRLSTLEESVSEIRRDHLESHKWFVTTFITIIFSLVGFFLAYTANQTKTDVRADFRDMRTQLQDTATQMETKVDNAIREMNQNFQNLAGEALKKPLIQISNNNGPLDGQVLTNQGGTIPLFPVFLKNVGEKRSGAISVRLYSTDALGLASGDWQMQPSNDRQFPYSFALWAYSAPGYSPNIAAQETSAITEPQPNPYAYSGIFPTNVIYCKLQVFYDSEKPAEARFQIKFR